jgi:signal recognition particle GTPase
MMTSFFDKYSRKEPTDRLVSDLEIRAKQTVKYQLAIIRPMTLVEKGQSSIVLNKSRLQRIANGSGTNIKQIEILFKQYNEMRKLMSKLKRKPPNNDLPPAIAAIMPLPEPPVITKAVARKYG